MAKVERLKRKHQKIRFNHTGGSRSGPQVDWPTLGGLPIWPRIQRGCHRQPPSRHVCPWRSGSPPHFHISSAFQGQEKGKHKGNGKDCKIDILPLFGSNYDSFSYTLTLNITFYKYLIYLVGLFIFQQEGDVNFTHFPHLASHHLKKFSPMEPWISIIINLEGRVKR